MSIILLCLIKLLFAFLLSAAYCKCIFGNSHYNALLEASANLKGHVIYSIDVNYRKAMDKFYALTSRNNQSIHYFQ